MTKNDLDLMESLSRTDEDIAALAYLRIQGARTDYFDRIDWNRKRLAKMCIPFEEFNRDLFYDLD